MTFSSWGQLSALVFSPPTTRATFTKCQSCTLPLGQIRLHFTTRANSMKRGGGRKTLLRQLARELCMKRPARHRSSPMECAERLNPLAQQHRDPFSKHGLSPLALRAHREPAMADKSTNSAKRITMSVAPCERTTAGRGCLLGRGPAVRIADPEEADPLNPQRGNAPGSAIVACSAKTFTNWAGLASASRLMSESDRASFAAYF